MSFGIFDDFLEPLSRFLGEGFFLFCLVVGTCSFFVDFYGMKTLECIGIPGFFDGFIWLTVSAFG